MLDPRRDESEECWDSNDFFLSWMVKDEERDAGLLTLVRGGARGELVSRGGSHSVALLFLPALSTF